MSFTRHPTRLTLDVVMDDFWTRATGVFGKPVWQRPGVLQIIFDDDNNTMRHYSGPSVPGGHVAYTRTASIYSETPITDEDVDISSTNPMTAELRKHVAAFTQRVKGCYLIEANILGFAGEHSGLDEQSVLGSAIKWALSDYADRMGEPPSQIVLHLDVNGTLALGDVASNKGIGGSANGLARDVLKRLEEEASFELPQNVQNAMQRARSLSDESVRQEYTVNYSGNDFIRAVVLCLGALAPAAIRDLDDELAGSFTTYASESTRRAFLEARSKEALESPAMTVAIRTNGVEHRQAAVYVQRLVCGVLGLELSEEHDTVRRYVVTHEDTVRGLFFHPVLLEKLHKSNGEYTFDDYIAGVGPHRTSHAPSRHERACSPVPRLALYAHHAGAYIPCCALIPCFSQQPAGLADVARPDWNTLPRTELGSSRLKVSDPAAAAAAWRAVSAINLKKSDAKFKCYLGLTDNEAGKPDDHSHAPPKLEVAFARETWLMPQVAPNAKHKDFKLAKTEPDSLGPWWAGFKSPVAASQLALRSKTRRASHQPYGMPIASEPVPTRPMQAWGLPGALAKGGAYELADDLKSDLHSPESDTLTESSSGASFNSGARSRGALGSGPGGGVVTKTPSTTPIRPPISAPPSSLGETLTAVGSHMRSSFESMRRALRPGGSPAAQRGVVL